MTDLSVRAFHSVPLWLVQKWLLSPKACQKTKDWLYEMVIETVVLLKDSLVSKNEFSQIVH